METAGIRVFTSPKVMSTSLKQLAFEVDTGTKFSGFRANGRDVSVHRFYPLRSLNPAHLSDGTISIAIVRDPIERFVSMHRNRVMTQRTNTSEQYLNLHDIGLEASPGLNELALRLEAYRAAVHDIYHHSLPQAFFLGTNLGVFDHLVGFSDKHRLEQLLAQLLRRGPRLLHYHKSSSGFQEEPSPGALSHLREFYAQDYELLDQLSHYKG